jgi:hypothetical protein
VLLTGEARRASSPSLTLGATWHDHPPAPTDFAAAHARREFRHAYDHH